MQRDSRVLNTVCYMIDRRDACQIIKRTSDYYYRVQMCVQYARDNDERVDCFVQENPPLPPYPESSQCE